MSVRVQKRPPVVDILCHSNFDPNVVCETRPSVPSCPSRRRHRRPLSVRPVNVARRLSVRPVVVVRRPLSVRPSRRRGPSSVRPSNYYLHDVA